ncbi:MAG: O-antigen ligase family protein [Solirubrobacteraceae bacterium]
MTDVTATAALAVGGGVLGVMYVLSARAVNPVALPALILFAAVLVLAFRRPEIGIAFELVIVPAATFGLVSGSGSLSSLLLALSAYLTAAAYLCTRAHSGRSRGNAIGDWLALFIGSAFLSLLQAQDSSAALHVVGRLVTAGLLFAATTMAVRDRRSLLWVLGAMMTAAGLVGAHALLDYSSGAIPSVGFITSSGQLVGRATAGFGQPNQLGGFLVVLVPIVVGGGLVARRWRSGFWLAAALAAFGVYVSFSRGALIGLAVVPFVFLRSWRTWLLGPALGLLAYVATPAALTERFATLTSSGAEIATRSDIWHSAVTIWEHHPLLGVGVGGFPIAYSTVNIPGKLYLPNTIFAPPPHAHNLVLNILAEQGLIGLAAFVGLMIIATRTTLRLRRAPEPGYSVLGSALLASLIAFFVHNLFDVTMFDSVTGPYVMVLLALVVALDRMAAGGVPLAAKPG